MAKKKPRLPTTAQLKKRLKAMEATISQARELLNLPPAAFPYPDKGRETTYFKSDAGRCPFCNSDNITNNGDWDGGPYDLSCTIGCDACGAGWVEIYHLKGACNFEVGTNPNEETDDGNQEAGQERTEEEEAGTEGP